MIADDAAHAQLGGSARRHALVAVQRWLTWGPGQGGEQRHDVQFGVDFGGGVEAASQQVECGGRWGRGGGLPCRTGAQPALPSCWRIWFGTTDRSERLRPAATHRGAPGRRDAWPPGWRDPAEPPPAARSRVARLPSRSPSCPEWTCFEGREEVARATAGSRGIWRWRPVVVQCMQDLRRRCDACVTQQSRWPVRVRHQLIRLRCPHR